jgi:hypothetical protein
MLGSELPLVRDSNEYVSVTTCLLFDRMIRIDRMRCGECGWNELPRGAVILSILFILSEDGGQRAEGGGRTEEGGTSSEQGGTTDEGTKRDE